MCAPQSRIPDGPVTSGGVQCMSKCQATTYQMDEEDEKTVPEVS